MNKIVKGGLTAVALASATPTYAEQETFTAAEVKDKIELILSAKDIEEKIRENVEADPAVKAFIADNPDRKRDCRSIAFPLGGILALPIVYQEMQKAQGESEPFRVSSEFFKSDLVSAERCAQLRVDALNDPKSREALVVSVTDSQVFVHGKIVENWDRASVETVVNEHVKKAGEDLQTLRQASSAINFN